LTSSLRSLITPGIKHCSLSPWPDDDSIGVKTCSTFQCITFNVIFGFEHRYIIVALDCDFYFLLKVFCCQNQETVDLLLLNELIIMKHYLVDSEVVALNILVV
jgi:hypothetical protein